MAFTTLSNVSAIQPLKNLNMANAGYRQMVSGLNSGVRNNSPIEDALGSDSAKQFRKSAAMVTISDEAKQKLAEYQSGTINNVADAQQVKKTAVNEAAAVQETGNFPQQQIRQQAGAATSVQAQGIHSLLRGE